MAVDHHIDRARPSLERNDHHVERHSRAAITVERSTDDHRAMSEDRYRCVCHTCETERLIEGLENAQAVFNEHADMAHEVELMNRQSRRRYLNSLVGTGRENDGSSADE